MSPLFFAMVDAVYYARMCQAETIGEFYCWRDKRRWWRSQWG